MKLKCLALSLILVLAPFLRAVPAQTQTETDGAAIIKAEVTKRLAHKKTHVNIDMLNGNKLKGRIEQAGDATFTIREDKTDQRVEVSYSDVRKLKGQGLGTGAKIGLIIGATAVVLAVVVVVAIKNFDPFEGGITAR